MRTSKVQGMGAYKEVGWSLISSDNVKARDWEQALLHRSVELTPQIGKREPCLGGNRSIGDYIGLGPCRLQEQSGVTCWSSTARTYLP